MIETESTTASTVSSDVIDVILRRRSNARTLPICPNRNEIERLLIAANAAPNHHLTQPWRFCVARGEMIERIADAVAQDSIDMNNEEDPAQADSIRQGARAKFARAPIVLVASVAPVDEHPKSIDWEDFAATAAAIQNLLLTAEATGLAAIWRSNTSQLVNLKSLLNLRAAAKVIGFIHIGYPDPSDLAPQKSRRPHSDFVQWRGWDD